MAQLTFNKERILAHALDLVVLIIAMFAFSWLGNHLEQINGMGYTMGIFTAIIVHAIYRYSSRK